VTFGESLTSLFSPWPSIELKSMISFATSSSRNFLFHLQAIGDFMLSLLTASFFSPHKSSAMFRCGDFALVVGLVIEEGVFLFTFKHDGIRNELDIYVFSFTTLQNVCPMELVSPYLVCWNFVVSSPMTIIHVASIQFIHVKFLSKTSHAITI
jgi:hypothetical protein